MHELVLDDTMGADVGVCDLLGRGMPIGFEAHNTNIVGGSDELDNRPRMEELKQTCWAMFR